MSKALFALLALACWAPEVLADSWEFPAKLIRKQFEFGRTKVVLEIDGTKNQAYPPHTLSVFTDDQLMAKYKNVGFEKIYASRDNRFFAGVSNGGIPGTAFVVFDADGNLLREEKHRYLPRGIHTELTTELVRRWFDDQNPDVEFDVREGRLRGVSIRGSNGQRYDLLAPDIGFRRKPTSQ